MTPAMQAEHISKVELYAELAAQLRALTGNESDPIANLANCAALLFHGLAEVNWAGFYFLKDGQLVLGPFQGRPACVRIPLGRGVCGTAAAKSITLRVADVHDFAGHIACDSASNSELVTPLLAPDGSLLGLLDLDSPKLGRFNADDETGVQNLARIIEQLLWTKK